MDLEDRQMVFKKIYSDLAKDHTIISVDALGFGRSSKPMDFYYSFPTHANLYYKLMKKTRLRFVCNIGPLNGRRNFS